MKFIPKKMKYTKIRKGKCPLLSSKGNSLIFGTYGLKAIEAGFLYPKQVEAGRRAIKRSIKEVQGVVWVRVFAHVPRTSKPSEVRMGRGKGRVDFWISKISIGSILYEIDNVTEKLAYIALNKAANKLPLRVKIIQE